MSPSTGQCRTASWRAAEKAPLSQSKKSPRHCYRRLLQQNRPQADMTRHVGSVIASPASAFYNPSREAKENSPWPSSSVDWRQSLRPMWSAISRLMGRDENGPLGAPAGRREAADLSRHWRATVAGLSSSFEGSPSSFDRVMLLWLGRDPPTVPVHQRPHNGSVQLTENFFAADQPVVRKRW